MTPCLCGHPFHFGVACSVEGCSCVRGAPDFVSGARDELARLSPDARAVRESELRKHTKAMAVLLGYRGPETTLLFCAYCKLSFVSWRSHATTCSGACRQALSVARGYECEADIPSAWQRHDSYSAERAGATGTGTITAAEGYALDLQAWQAWRARPA